MYQVIEAGQPGPRVQVVGRFEDEGTAVSYATGQQQVHREANRLWFVRPDGDPPTWVIDGDGIKRKPSRDELETYFP